MLLYSLAGFCVLLAMMSMLTLVEKFPIKYLYYHYHYRKPLVWVIYLSCWAYILYANWPLANFELDKNELIPMAIMSLGLVMNYKMHQENWFKADNFPEMTKDLFSLPISDESEIALIDFNGVFKAYPLDYVIHHHVVNDKFGNKTVSLTYCAMCRSIIPFDITDIGPLMVVSFKNSNMVLGDVKTKTFFQQETFNSVLGKLHPHSLSMIPFQVLPWSEVKQLNPIPETAIVDQNDFREFNLPIPFIWKKVKTSEFTPGLNKIDKSFPSKTRVIGTIELTLPKSVVYLKKEVLAQKIVLNEELNITLMAVGNTVVGFSNTIGELKLELTLNNENKIEDQKSHTTWDLRGHQLSGDLSSNLCPIALADEFWFAWKKFHNKSELIRL